MLFENRSRAESFGNVAQLYDRARPTYPPELVDSLLSDGPRHVVDIGCGTGIAGALFAARGCEVTGVEVDPRMAAVAQTKGIEVEVASFEQWDDRGRRFELAISAQAWHWIEPQDPGLTIVLGKSTHRGEDAASAFDASGLFESNACRRYGRPLAPRSTRSAGRSSIPT
jgi:predicted TPR repeat methyltransferase